MTHNDLYSSAFAFDDDNQQNDDNHNTTMFDNGLHNTVKAPDHIKISPSNLSLKLHTTNLDHPSFNRLTILLNI